MTTVEQKLRTRAKKLSDEDLLLLWKGLKARYRDWASSEPFDTGYRLVESEIEKRNLVKSES